MKKLLFGILTLAAMTFTSTAFAQDKALLYEVSGKGLAQPSYLYGTFHLVCPADLQITEAIRKAMGQSKRLYLELDFDDPTLMTSMMKSMVLAGGKNLKDLLKPDDYTALDSYLQKNLGVGLAQFGSLKPIAIQSMMFTTMLQCEPASYDVKFAEIAGQQGKEVLGLETLEEQLAALDKIPMEQQLKDLVDMARHPQDAQKELSTLLTAYKAQDLPQLMKLMKESKFDGDTELLNDELLSKRNNNWLPVIEKAAQEKATFFAFGAGHLGGPQGIVSLLREKGYTVKVLQ